MLSALLSRNRNSAETLVREILDAAGVGVHGKEPGDILVQNPRFYDRLVRHASLGLGESYMDEWWECDRLDLFVEKIIRVDVKKKLQGSLRLKLLTLRALLTNMQSLSRAKAVAEAHYDLGNGLYEVMLDPRMMYSCGYWKNATNLAEAQEHKLDLICKKAGLAPGMRVLDIGCGFGGFAMYAAERYGCDVVGVTVSSEQLAWGTAEAARKGLTGVDLRIQDYRAIEGTFDRVVSIGMFEHVGWRNHRLFMEVARRSLAPDGVAVLHTIGTNRSQKHGQPFFAKYIFPNGNSPSLTQLGAAIEDIFVPEDVHNIGPDYTPTLLAWWKNFEAGYPTLDSTRYDRRFYRMWRFYLLASAGSFAARENQLYQLVLTPIRRAQPDCRVS